MKRPFAFAVLAVGTAMTLLAAGQQPKTKPGKTVTPKTTEGGAPAVTKDGGAVVEQRQVGDGGAKVFRFGEVEVEGRLKSPQIVYFLRRVRAEFAAGDLGHRPFTSELSETRNESSF